MIAPHTLVLCIALGLYVVSVGLKLFHSPRASTVLLLGGFAAHTIYLAARGWLAETFVPNPIFEGPFFIPWFMAAIAAASSQRRGRKEWVPIVLGSIAFSILDIFSPQGIVPPSPKTNSPWVLMFFSSEGAALALFYCGAMVSGFELTRKKFASLGCHQYLVWGFVLYSLAQMVGAYWCYLGWGNTFRWSPRHLNSAAIWMLYAAYLHLKFVPGWTMPRRAWFALVSGGITLAVTLPGYLHEMSLTRIGG